MFLFDWDIFLIRSLVLPLHLTRIELYGPLAGLIKHLRHNGLSTVIRSQHGNIRQQLRKSDTRY